MFLPDPSWVQYTGSAVIGSGLTWATLRLTSISIWRTNAEGYKAEMERQAEMHDAQMKAMEAKLESYSARLDAAEGEITRLRSLTDVTPILRVVPLIEELHSTLVSRVPTPPTH